MHTTQLRPSQLVILPDGTSIGFRAPGGNTAQQVAYLPAILVGVPWHELLSGHFRVAYIAADLRYIGNDVPARPPLSRWGCSAKLGGVWLCSGLLFVAAWFGLLLLARVALPRACELRGLSEDEAWGRAKTAMGLGLLNMFVIIDLLKIVALVGTGPGVTSLILRIRNPRVQFVVRNAAQTVHLPLALICP